MANYIKTTDFAAKDALSQGDPNKIAQGSQVDTEFNNIATAIATKEDTANRAQANGYASLDSNGDVPSAQISEASVTQHEAALDIAETQITDGSILARLAANETVSGTWAFSINPTMPSGATNWHSGNDGSGSGLDADTLDGVQGASYLQTSSLLSSILAVDGSGSGIDSDLCDGYHVSESATGSTIAARNSSGYLFAQYFNSAHSPVASGTVDNVICTIGDGYMYKITKAYFQASMALDSFAGTLATSKGGTGTTVGLINVTGKNGVSKTLSTSNPSGGSDGDIWYKY